MSFVQAQCVRLHGHEFLLAFAYSRSADATDLPVLLRRAFGALATAPAAPWEVAASSRRLADDTARLEVDTPRRADELARWAARPREDGARLDPATLEPAALDAQRLKAAAAHSFTDSHRILLYFSPFEG